ncbi:hypothetical protein Pfo_019568 [Paulownia fortunei]|nr:hypothetical protein Pfo_019568 [Paulownia fortunei]
MGTKIQANSFLLEYHSVINLDGSISNGMRSLYHETQLAQNGHNPDSVTSWTYKNGHLRYDTEKVRQTILKHELIFRNQARQRELMDEMKTREIKKDDVKEEKSQSSSLFSPILPEYAKGTWNAPHSSSLHSMVGSKLFSIFPEDKSRPILPPTRDAGSTCKALLSKSSILPKRTYDLEIPADACTSNMEKHMQDRYFKLPRNHQPLNDRDAKSSLSGVWAPKCDVDVLRSNLYFRRSNNEADLNMSNPTEGNPGSLTPARGDVSANSYPNFHLVSNDLFKNSLDGMNGGDSLINLGLRDERSGKEHLSADCAEKRRFDEHSSIRDFCSGKSPTFPQSASWRKRTKIFGVEFSEGHDDPMEATSNTSSTILKNGIINSESSPGSPWKKESIYFGSENCQSKLENPLKGGLPWFLRNPQYSVEPSKGIKSCYFLNLDSWQNCSERFFGKAETDDGSFQNLKQKKDISAPMGAQDAKDGTNEVNHGSGAKRILGFPISNMLQSFKDLNSADTLLKVNCSGIEYDSARKVKKDEGVPRNQLGNRDIVLQKGLDNYISDLRQHIHLNLSSDKEDGPSAPSLPTAIVKIATTEIDWEAPIVIKFEADASPKENSRKMVVRPPGNLKYLMKNVTELLLRMEPMMKKNPFRMAFEELFKAEGCASKLGLSQQNSARNVRGRKRPGGPNLSPTTKALCLTATQQPIFQLEEISLTGWGKRTRRLTRQRCPNGNENSGNGVIGEASKVFEEIFDRDVVACTSIIIGCAQVGDHYAKEVFRVALDMQRKWAGPSVPNRVEAYLRLESDKKIVGNFGTYESAVLGVDSADKLVELRRSRAKRARSEIPGPPPPKGSLIEHQKQLGLWALKPLSADSTVVRRTLAFRKKGPSEDEVASVGHGFSDASTLASQGNKKPDTKVITRVMGPECALIVLADRDNLPKGAVFTPAIVFGPTDLQENGISFDLVSKNNLFA